MLNFVFSSEVLGVRREHFQVLFKDPSRRNLFHQIREVDKIETTFVSFKIFQLKTTWQCYVIAISIH